MVKEDLKVIAQYYELYTFLWQEPRTKEQIAKYVVDDLKMAKSTGSVYSNDVFAGNLPLVVVADDKAFVDQMQYREFMEKFSTEIGGKDAYKLFCEPPPAPKGKNTESEIGKITTTESPIVQELNKKLGSEKAKVSKLKKELSEIEGKHKKELEELRAALEKELSDICLRLLDKTSESILGEMKCRMFVTQSIHSTPREVLAMDYFLDDPAKTLDVPKLVSKYGGEKDSIYEVIDDEDKKLDVGTHIDRVSRALFQTNIFKKRAEDESRLRLVGTGQSGGKKDKYKKRRKITGAEIYENRLRTINEILTNPALSNQQKLAFYAGWSEYKGSEFAENLALAGEKGLDAGYVIRLLENPLEHDNYHNVRAFLLQALKSSEARIKREAVKELICGEWYVEAEYGGKMCKFQMMPVDELIAFKEALERLQLDEAIKRAENLVGIDRVAVFKDDDAGKKLFVERRKTEKEKNLEREQAAVERIHQMEVNSGVDVHVPVDVEYEDGFENREASNGEGQK